MTINELLGRPVASIDDIDGLFRSPPATLGIAISSQSARICLLHLWRHLQRTLGATDLAAELEALGQLEPEQILTLRGSRPSYYLAYIQLAQKGATQ